MLDVDVFQDLLPVVDFAQVLLDKQFFPLKLISQLWYILFQNARVMAIQHYSAINILTQAGSQNQSHTPVFGHDWAPPSCFY